MTWLTENIQWCLNLTKEKSSSSWKKACVHFNEVVFNFRPTILGFLSSGGTLSACLAHSRFRPTTVAYSQGKFLTNATQHRSYLQSARYSRAGIWTYDIGVMYLALLCAAYLVAQVWTSQDACKWIWLTPASVSKVKVGAQIVCKSSFTSRQPQPSSNISHLLERNYSAFKERQQVSVD